jgi:hypothetical protein
MMKKKIRRRWVAALRSSEFPQISGNLRQQGGQFEDGQHGYCCLGVLCELAWAEGVVTGQWNARSGIWSYGRNTETGVLPQEVVEWAGLDSDDPLVPNPAGSESDEAVVSLTTVNDCYELPFPRIAGIIEAYL